MATVQIQITDKDDGAIFIEANCSEDNSEMTTAMLAGAYLMDIASELSTKILQDRMKRNLTLH